MSMVQKCHLYQIFSKKMHAHPTPLHPMVVVSPFTKWGLDFIMCWLASIVGHTYIYIIVAIAYFTKWVKHMPTYSHNTKIATCLIFNHIISRFDMPMIIVTDHGSHFCNNMMSKLATLLHFGKEQSSPYYPWDTGQVESISSMLKTRFNGWWGNIIPTRIRCFFWNYGHIIPRLRLRLCLQLFSLFMGWKQSCQLNVKSHQ